MEAGNIIIGPGILPFMNSKSLWKADPQTHCITSESEDFTQHNYYRLCRKSMMSGLSFQSGIGGLGFLLSIFSIARLLVSGLAFA